MPYLTQVIDILNYYRKICKISPIAVGLSVSVCAFVCVSVTFFVSTRKLAKIKNDICRLRYLPSAEIEPDDPDLHFQGQIFQVPVLTSK